jgi:hypothetical protein
MIFLVLMSSTVIFEIEKGQREGMKSNRVWKEGKFEAQEER